MMTTMTKKSTFYVVSDNADTVFLILRADGKTRVFPFSVDELDSLMESYRLLSGGSVSVAEAIRDWDSVDDWDYENKHEAIAGELDGQVSAGCGGARLLAEDGNPLVFD